MSFSDYLENQIIEDYLRTGTVYLALFTADPGEGTPSNEVTAGGNSYARQTVTWDAPSGGATANSAEVRFDDMPAVTVTHFAVIDALTGGNVLYIGDVNPDETTGAGDNLVFPAGSLTITND